MGLHFPAGLKWYVSWCVPVIIMIIYLKGYYDMFKGGSPLRLAFWMAVAVCMLGYVIFSAAGKPKMQATKRGRK